MGIGRLTVRLGSAVLIVALTAVGVTVQANAQLDVKPARTWGVGPATTTSASVGKPRVLAIVPVGDRIFVGGTFDSVIDPAGVSYPVKNLAVFSAATGAADLSFKAAANNTVTSLATDGSRLFIGGTFGTLNGSTRKGLGAIEIGTGQLTSWNPAVSSGQVDALAYAGGAVYAGGNFSSIAGSTGSSQGFAAKIDASSAAVDTNWLTAPNDRVRALNVAADGSGRLFIAGDFTSVSGKSGTNKLAAVALTAPGAVDTAFRAGPTNGSSYAPVYDLTSDAARVYTASAGSGGACAGLSSSTGAVSWSAHSSGNMQSVRLLDGLLYCAGHYGGTGSFMGQTRQKLAAVVASTGALTAFAPNINSSQGPWSLATAPGRLYVGGDFSTISGVPQPHFAMFVDSAARTVPQPPGSPAAKPGDTLVTLSWAPPSSDGGSPLQKYRVYRSTAAGGQNLEKSPLATLSADARVFTDTAVVNGVTYYYVVVATNAMGASRPSAEVIATPGAGSTATAPSAPTSVSGSSPPGHNYITWNPPPSDGGSPVTSYRVYRGTTSGGTKSQVASVTATAFDDLYGLTAGTTYYYTVTAVNRIGEGRPSSEIPVTTTLGVPGPPALTATAAAGPSAALHWSIPPDGGSPITKYVILRDGVRLVTLQAAADGGPTTYTDTTVSSGVAYTYQVRAANVAGNGQLSNKAVAAIP
jgi:fibronectin type 3 domain-containing protein